MTLLLLFLPKGAVATLDDALYDYFADTSTALTLTYSPQAAASTLSYGPQTSPSTMTYGPQTAGSSMTYGPDTSTAPDYDYDEDGMVN